MEDLWLKAVSSVIASIAFVWVMMSKHPIHLDVRLYDYINSKLFDYFYPYIHIKFSEPTQMKSMKSESNHVYKSIDEYLRSKSNLKPKRFEAEFDNGHKDLELSMDSGQEIEDNFNGFVFWWRLYSVINESKSVSVYPAPDRMRFFDLSFHRDHRELVCNVYLKHVIETARISEIKKRKSRIYTNILERNKTCKWEDVVFEHPATFEKIAMDPIKKEEIKNDLRWFSRSENLYSEIGKVWKRGYLLYGPPGTGKSSLVAAMANFLNYSVYDLELTSVKDNTMLRSLLIQTKKKSIIVIEDVDCSIDLTGKRKGKKKKKNEGTNDLLEKLEQDEEENDSVVTLSGLLNFIDGLWSTCGGERLIVFTTNHLNKLDPALIRAGRMDMHIELSYCSFEAFKIFAKNYLHIKEHKLFSKIENLMAEVMIAPADVAEKLLPKCKGDDDLDATECLDNLIQTLLYKKANPIIEDLASSNDMKIE